MQSHQKMDTKMTDQEDLPLSINRMPAELLTMIAEHLALETADIWKCLLVYPELKNLRLVSRQFAYLPFIMSYMFNGIRLLASPEHVKLAETTSLDRLKPYVKKITFEPTKYSWVMTPQLFEEILFVQPLKEAVDAHNNHVNDTMENAPHDAYIGEDTIGDLGSAEFIKKYMDGKAPFTKQELEDGYAKYMAHAQELRTLFDSSKVDAAWTHAIKQLPNAKHFITSEWDYNGELSTMYKHENHGRNWKVRGCEIFGHHHDRGNHDQAPCQRLQAPVGEAVFNAAISSLASGGSTITQLEIHNIFDNSFKCVNNARIKGLNLTNLETLHFSPNIAEIGKSRKRAAIVNKRRSLCHAALNTLLKRSVNSLKVISVQLDHPHTFPPPHVPAMPALEQFSTNAGLNLTDFANFIASARKLRQLELGIGCSGANGDWRELWRAIRYHPSRMDLNFDQIPCNDCAEITMHHNTGRESESENDPSDTWMNIYYSLEMYLSNKGQWNKSCRMWFEDAASDDNRSDSDSVGGEDGGDDDGEWEDE